MKTIFKVIKRFFRNLGGWFYSIWILRISQSDIPFGIYGYNHFSFSKKYANKRKKRNGLRHYCLPAGRGSEMLIVFNSKEMKALKRKGFMNKRVTIAVLLSEAYFVTKR